ncbi:E3 ubiquitin-protein ligase UHRF1-like [Acanthaster planci]|uniref:RING-type E3 ubiquitin transferase n=1 Tax=Acanthaster planci TaxID=133434 RepID=A0A8B7Y4P0_ACAPL|nr:E3 ubiquitin-protein ligase UHRF1-like [Acanthaster planci]
MWIQVRSFDGKKSIRVDGLSKLTKIEDLRPKLVAPFDAPCERQRLFYRGKQLEDGQTLFDYSVGLNDIIQIMIKAQPAALPATTSDYEAASHSKPDSGFVSENSDSEHSTSGSNSSDAVHEIEDKPSTSTRQFGSTYQVGDLIDALDLSIGAWFEADIIKITPASSTDEGQLNSVNCGEGVAKDIAVDANHNIRDISATNSDAEKTAKDADGRLQSFQESETGELVNGNGSRNSVATDAQDSNSDGRHTDPSTPVSKDSALQQDESKTVGKEQTSTETGCDGFIYHVKFEGYEDQGVLELPSKYLRPRARTMISFDDVRIQDVVMVNYNPDEPKERGFWYDVEVTSKKTTRTYKELIGNVRLGIEADVLKDCRIRLTDEIFKIEKPGEVTCDPALLNGENSPMKRSNKAECAYCKDNPRRKCKHCACHVCGGKDDPDRQLMCDECDMAYHLGCLDPPLTEIPDVEEWYCPLCKNDASQVVMAGEKLKHSKKKAKMASAVNDCKRDWGKGMACQGRTKVCTIVPPNHFGEIPGIHVGQSWKFRVQVSEAGVHRPHVAGIHGREDEGAYSIVLAGGYEDDEDRGFEFLYTGSGGRDLSGNKRTAEQSMDQKLTKMNMALARNCNATLDTKNGNEAKDWRAGKPVRVVRNSKGRKHSKYAPEEGNRYDGLYKVVKFWPEKGRSGFLVWRYLLRRDDPQPMPWSKEGIKRIKELALKMEYPEGYLEAMAAKEKEANGGKESEDSEEDGGKKKRQSKGKGRKRKRDESGDDMPASSPKKTKVVIPPEIKKLIKEDGVNKKVWDEIAQEIKTGKTFLSAVEEAFTCICCQEVAYQPVTMPCQHNICKSCLQRSFKASVYQCPYCRYDLGKGYSMSYNKQLQTILKELFPGYEAGR